MPWHCVLSTAYDMRYRAVLLFAIAQAHVTLVGSNGPTPNDPAFFKADANSPCPVDVVDTTRINATVGETFAVTWALVVNHNTPPNTPGRIHFKWAKGIPNQTTQFANIAPPVPVVDQMTNYYFTQSVVIIAGDESGRATLQLVYDTNGAPGPFPMYYQCINIFAIEK